MVLVVNSYWAPGLIIEVADPLIAGLADRSVLHPINSPDVFVKEHSGIVTIDPADPVIES